MRSIWAVCKREFISYFTTPVGFVIVGVYALLSGLYFTGSFIIYCRITQNPSSYGYDAIPEIEEWMLSPFLVLCGQLLMFIGPLVTMRLLSEERNKGTMELLLTHPLRDREIIFGKYLASLATLLVLMLIVGFHLTIIGSFTPIEPVVLGLGLVTVFLMGAAFFSMGLFVSSLANNQVTAGTMTFGIALASWILGLMGQDLPEAIPTPDTWPAGLVNAAEMVYGIFRELVVSLPLDAHARDLAEGIIHPHDIAYYLLFTSFFLFLTFRTLESRKWRA